MAGLLGLFALFVLVSVSTTKGEDVVTETEELDGRDGKGKISFLVHKWQF